MCFAGNYSLNMKAVAGTFKRLHPVKPHLTEIGGTEEGQQTVGAVLTHLNSLDDKELVRVVRESACAVHTY